MTTINFPNLKDLARATLTAIENDMVRDGNTIFVRELATINNSHLVRFESSLIQEIRAELKKEVTHKQYQRVIDKIESALVEARKVGNLLFQNTEQTRDNLAAFNDVAGLEILREEDIFGSVIIDNIIGSLKACETGSSIPVMTRKGQLKTLNFDPPLFADILRRDINNSCENIAKLKLMSYLMARKNELNF